jgi:hypothetical protein
MRLAQISRIRIAMPVGSWMYSAWPQTGSTPRAFSATSLGSMQAVPWFDDGIAEILLSEALVLCVCAVLCGLLVAGIEAFDLWRERRTATAGACAPGLPVTQIGRRQGSPIPGDAGIHVAWSEECVSRWTRPINS